jgi:hypothetical protein
MSSHRCSFIPPDLIFRSLDIDVNTQMASKLNSSPGWLIHDSIDTIRR